MQEPRQWATFGNNNISIHSIQAVVKLTDDHYQLRMDNGDQFDINGEDRCNILKESAANRLGLLLE